MVELKQKILTSLAKLSDRDTHQIAMDDLQAIVNSLSSDALPMLLNSLYDAVSSDPKPSAHKDSLRLLALTCTAHPDPASAHLTKIISHITKRLKDNDSGGDVHGEDGSSAFQKLCPRICRLLNNHSFLAKASLLGRK
jgi:hypothetical protein